MGQPKHDCVLTALPEVEAEVLVHFDSGLLPVLVRPSVPKLGTQHPSKREAAVVSKGRLTE